MDHRRTQNDFSFEEKKLLEIVKRDRNNERANLLKSLCGLHPVIGRCNDCRNYIYAGSLIIDDRCNKCYQNNYIEKVQTRQLDHILDQFRDNALNSGNLLAHALFERKRSLESSDMIPQFRDDFVAATPSDLKIDEDESSELFCHIKKCGDKYLFDEMLVCDICQRGFHARCCDPPLNYSLAVRYPWFCTMDKLCIICNSTEQESSMLLCDGCDRSFHQWCSVPPIKHVPEGEWYCNDCAICSKCNLLLPPEDLKSPLTFGLNNVRVCSSCLLKQPKMRLHLCHVCLEIKEPHQVICKCSGCDQEVHRECCRPGPSFPIWCWDCLGENNDEDGLSTRSLNDEEEVRNGSRDHRKNSFPSAEKDERETDSGSDGVGRRHEKTSTDDHIQLRGEDDVLGDGDSTMDEHDHLLGSTRREKIANEKLN